MAKMIMTSQGLKIDSRGVALDKDIEKRDVLKKELQSLSRFRFSRRREIKQELKGLNRRIRFGAALTTGIDPGR